MEDESLTQLSGKGALKYFQVRAFLERHKNAIEGRAINPPLDHAPFSHAESV